VVEQITDSSAFKQLARTAGTEIVQSIFRDGAAQPASLKGPVLYPGWSRCARHARHVQRRYPAQVGCCASESGPVAWAARWDHVGEA
jgi:hypothetical protein